ncbi:MAG: hypothetical protein ACLQQB_04930 [Solirubrobacteraceae bacterium]|jgi:hypothetical protein
MADQPTPARKSGLAPHEVRGMSLDVFMPENRLARARAEARKRAVKRWLNRLLKRSQGTQAADLD